nr:HEAT repeat domain-containing protein [Oculatella sp. LEGE 06141]
MIQSVEQADSPSRLIAAVRALADACLEAGIPTLISVLGYNNPEAAVIAVDGLIQLGKVAVPALLEQLDDYNYGARAYSFRALAAIADPRAIDVLLNAAEADFAPSVRRAAAKGLGNLDWSQLPADQRRAAQDRALKALLHISTDADWAIRYAAVVGLQGLAEFALGQSPAALSLPTDWMSPIGDRFEQMAKADADLAVRARVAVAQQQLEDSHENTT